MCVCSGGWGWRRRWGGGYGGGGGGWEGGGVFRVVFLQRAAIMLALLGIDSPSAAINHR